jgi:hypothetical protein
MFNTQTCYTNCLSKQELNQDIIYEDSINAVATQKVTQ